MTSLPTALTQGDDIDPDNPEPRHLAQRIAERVAARSNGIIRSIGDRGAQRSENYISLWRRAADIAAALKSAGATPSCTVVILVDDIIDFLPAFWACLRGGFMAVTLTHAAKEFVFRDDPAFTTAVGLLSHRFFLIDRQFEGATKLIESLPGPIVSLSSVGPAVSWTDHEDVQDPACLVATSGSTGTLKLVALSHATLIARSRIGIPAPRTDAWHGIGTFPLDSVTGQHAIFLPYGSWTQLSPGTFARDPCAVLDAIESADGDVITLTNAMINAILAADARDPRPRRLASLKFVGVGAEPISSRSMQAFADLLGRYGAPSDILTAGYGTTETGRLVVGSPAIQDETLQGAVCLGRPASGVQMRIVDDQGAFALEGDIGEVEVSCPEKLFSGYWGDADLTRDGLTDDGWWKTRDLGKIVDGRLFLHGRARDVLILNGRKFSLADIDTEMRDALSPGDVAYACVVVADDQELLAVVFTVADAATADHAEQQIKAAIARRFGIQPKRLLCVEADAIPTTASGKIRRDLLRALLAANPDIPAGPPLDADHAALAAIWNTALGRKGAVAADADFFAQGGDSLRSLTLHLQIADAFRVHIASDMFFAQPTFDNLLYLVRAPAAVASEDVAEAELPWRLPISLEKNLLAALETWPGERSTPGRTMLSINAAGKKPPLFWVFNDPDEPAALARHLGDDQPLFAFRSGVAVSDYSEDAIQALALRYVADLVATAPAGPLVIGGNCQGAIIALAMAQHAVRRKRHVALLVLMDWAFALQAYPGPVLLIAGRDNDYQNAARLFARPELAWSRAFASHEFVEIPGGYADGLKPGAIEVLSALLADRMHSAMSRPLPLMPTSGYRATVSVADVDGTWAIGERVAIDVVVTNVSDVAWAATDESGIVLSYRWLSPAGERLRIDASHADLPALGTGSSASVRLDVTAPSFSGDYTLNIELCEEGHRWFSEPSAGYRASLRIV